MCVVQGHAGHEPATHPPGEEEPARHSLQEVSRERARHPQPEESGAAAEGGGGGAQSHPHRLRQTEGTGGHLAGWAGGGQVGWVVYG